MLLEGSWKRWKLSVVVGLVALFALGSHEAFAQPVVFELPRVDGLERSGNALPGIDAETFVGKTTVLHVIATWCVPCRDEGPALRRLAADPRVQVIAIFVEANPTEVADFVNRLGNPYAAVGLDAAGDALRALGGYGVPTTIVINEAAQIEEQVPGPLTVAVLESIIEPSLAEVAARIESAGDARRAAEAVEGWLSRRSPVTNLADLLEYDLQRALSALVDGVEMEVEFERISYSGNTLSVVDIQSPTSAIRAVEVLNQGFTLEAFAAVAVGGNNPISRAMEVRCDFAGEIGAWEAGETYVVAARLNSYDAAAVTFSCSGPLRVPEPETLAEEVPAFTPPPTFTVVTEDGRLFTERELAGRPSLIFFGFTRCPDICPTALAELSAHLNTLGPRADEIAVYFVSVDPGRDTPDAISQYLTYFHPAIVGLTGRSNPVDFMLDSFGVTRNRVNFEGSYTIDHTASFFLLDASGAIAEIVAWGELTTAMLLDFLGPPPTRVKFRD